MKVRLKSQEVLKELLSDYYVRLAESDRPVAWCTSVGPAELLRSFGFEVYFPENHGALIGAKRLGGEYISQAAGKGYSQDICSYLTSDIGAYLAGESPLKQYGLDGPPPPAVLVFNTSQCREVKEWMSFYAGQFGVPLLGVHTPQNVEEVTPELVDFLESDYREMIPELERISGTKFDDERFCEVLWESERACQGWRGFLDSNRMKPARHTFFDHIFLMAPVVVLRGEASATQFYDSLIAETEGLPGDPGTEKHRFYWDGMPIWGKTRYFARLFSDHGITVPASTYCHSWAFDFTGEDRDDPLRQMARAYAEIFIARSESWKLDYLARAADDFSIEAFLFHDAKTCPHNTNNRFGMPSRLKDATNLPYLIFEGDLVDLRHFAEEQFNFRLEAFLEQLEV
jgi:benzoyl-CoA reductase/2-hydroxyglutaryl-CoA dehydratase subunit BcrC/BadD/HgdB